MKNLKKNAICFKLFWYNVFVHWKFKLLNFLTDSALTANFTSLDFPQISFLGVYAAAHNLDIEWVVIKGISGYADGINVKDSWRTFASFMAASLTAHILSDTIAFQALPHCGSASEYWTFRKLSCCIFQCHLLFFSFGSVVVLIFS